MVAAGGYHASAHEGMLVADRANGKPSVVATAVRAMSKELGQQTGEHYDIHNLRCVGVSFDTKRLQPLVTFLLKARVDSAEAPELARRAPDSHEHWIGTVPWSLELARKLVQNDIRLSDDEGRRAKVPIASNHAQASHALAASAFGWG